MNKYKNLSNQVSELYQEMDKSSKTYKETHKLSCVSKCNHCCKNSNVSATPLEMIPLAMYLIESGKVPSDEQLDKDTCIFSTKMCSVYSYRPTVCRLFGWVKVSGKVEDRLAICPKVQTVTGKLTVTDAPDIELFALKVKELYPQLGSQILPINQALKEILNIIKDYNSYSKV